MKRLQGWILDLYPTATAMAVWILGQDGRGTPGDAASHGDPGSRRCYFDERFRPSFYARGPLPELRSLGGTLRGRFSGLTATLTERMDLWTHRQVTVLAVAPACLAAFTPAVKYVRQTTPRLDLFNADLLPEQVYCYEHQVFPLARCEIEVGGDRLHALRCLDDPWTTDHDLPPLRVLKLRPDCGISNPNHGGRFSVEVQAEGNTWLLDEADGEPLAQSLAGMLTRYDPDLIVSEWGDSYLLPRLIRQAAALRIGLPLNRDSGRHPLQKQGRSYFSYGRIVFKDAATYLFGRLHVDLRNSFVCAESGLEGLYELVRLTKLPLQYCARTSTGTGITSMQLDLAYQDGILIPSQKAEPERTKSGLELIVADRGGLVFHPKLGLFENVAELDFASMFPSIMARFNVSPETVNCGCCENNLVPELGYAICQRWRGIVARTVGPIIAKREKYKALLRNDLAGAPDRPGRLSQAVYDARQNALKWMLVTCFGYQGFKNARFGRIEAHEAINCFGRDRLLAAKELAESQGYEVLHALVDSLWLYRRGAGEPDYKSLAQEITAATDLPMSVAGIYRWIVFVPSESSPRIGVPNRYFGVMQGGTLKIRGIQMRRQDCPSLVARMQEEILEVLKEAAGREQYLELLAGHAKEILESYVARLRDGQVQAAELAISTRLSQYPEKYAHATRAAVAAQSLRARGVHLRPGETVEYLICDTRAKVPAERVRPVEMLEGGMTYDRQEYERLLREAFRPFIPLPRQTE
jgi:DNA polymerase elongation subunit (family B)